MYETLDLHECGDGEGGQFPRFVAAVMAFIPKKLKRSKVNVQAFADNSGGAVWPVPKDQNDEVALTNGRIRLAKYGGGLFLHHQLGGQRVAKHPLPEHLVN